MSWKTFELFTNVSGESQTLYVVNQVVNQCKLVCRNSFFLHFFLLLGLCKCLCKSRNHFPQSLYPVFCLYVLADGLLSIYCPETIFQLIRSRLNTRLAFHMFLSLICEYLYLTSINLGLDAIIENIVSQEVTSQLNLCCAIRFVLCHGRGLLC